MIKRITGLFLLIVIALTGCSGNEAETPEVIAFEKDTVFIVGDKVVNLAKWNLYALPQYEETDRLYGSSIWDYVVDARGTTMKSAVKDDIKSQIVYTEIVCSRAEELGLQLTEEDNMDINLMTAAYMDGLTPEMIDKYGIKENDVREIYADNKLALKVYEYLTLNVDTSTTEKQVRNMILEYVPIMKYHDGDNDEIVMYDDDEMEERCRKALDYLDRVKADPDVTKLSDLTDEEFTPITVTADYSTLVDKLSEKIAIVAFSMQKGEINGLYDSTDALFILDCVEPEDEAATNAAKIRIIEERQREYFAEKYGKWSDETSVRINHEVWDTL
ncbi:MAG: hypothetical protein K6F93_02075 [Lachnospiraceae bacterium]|nr:hypothetical protein [Lachnospiraceae bacterium]